ncbi:unnamed protein product [Thlaspi arvense]|uniref:NB-ARC domain-containing protein n=1 Tax=Thlaspi arvense TaxID=13288 RepID=A0AAU9RMC2_THLAR|nr:unnamed protein product [Thlaspi arvense]
MPDIFSVLTSTAPGIPPVWSFLSGHVDYISNLDDNLDELRSALEDLKARRDDLIRKVVAEEIKGQRRLAEVERWRSKVQTVETNTNLLICEASVVQLRLSTYGYCSFTITIFSAYLCGKKILKMLSEVQKLISAKVSEVMTRQATLLVVVEEPYQQTFGLESKLLSTWSLLMEDGTRMLGLYGMGGVGKTTLLTLICNKFLEVKIDFDVVIWVKVSKDVDIGKIQDEIGERLGLYDENWCKKTQREKKCGIHRVLKNTKPRFVLLLDDLWEEVSLNTIGIPVKGGKYKIVFTTRLNSVCRGMRGVYREVERLADKDALDMLTQISGRGGEMLDLAERIAKKCHGLPLAIEVIGKCLSSRTTEHEWRDVLDTLASSPDVLEGMEEEMFGVLKVSYDYLAKEDAKLCFQYCALFPMGYTIKQDELVEYWIGEGIIDVTRGRDRAKSRGVEIISTLVGAGLLLKDEASKQKVYMHNMIREMALCIVSEIRDGKMYLVKTDAGLSQMPDVPDWTAVTKMSLVNNEIPGIPDDPEFPEQAPLITLFLQNNRLVEIGCKFFAVMSTLVVLDLSSNPDITKLPDEISELVSLRYLKLLGTRIKDLPEGFKKLLKLIHLDLESTSSLRSISLISGLQKLQVLRFYASAVLDGSLLKNLESLKGLQLLTITVREVDVLKAFLGSKRLPKCTQGLYLDGLEVSGVSGKSFAATFGELGSLSKLKMTDCDIKESETEWEENRSLQCLSPPPSPSNQRSQSKIWFENLSAVVIYSCVGLTDLTWLVYAANLQSLSVKISPKMKEVINEEKAGNVEVDPFQKLQVLDLGYLDELESIYWTSLSFPRLEKVSITECPKLRKLPLNSTSVDGVDDLRIEVDEGWLVGVEWESGAEERFRLAIHTASVS